jgi:hypothetical protein
MFDYDFMQNVFEAATVVAIVLGRSWADVRNRMPSRRRAALDLSKPGETLKVGRNSEFSVAILRPSVDVEPVLEQMGKGARIACPGRTNGGSKHL